MAAMDRTRRLSSGITEAREMAESFKNGNRTTVAQELAAMSPTMAARVALRMGAKLSVDERSVLCTLLINRDE